MHTAAALLTGIKTAVCLICSAQAGPVGPIEGPDPKVMEFLRILEEYR
jgi:hypothetical protein